MKTRRNNQVKLLVSIINKADQSQLTSAINGVATAMHFSGIGHGTARSNHRAYFGIDDVEKRVTFSLIPSNLESQILGAVSRELKLYLFGKGIAFTMPLKATQTKKEKKTMHELVIAVVNAKYSDTALEAARAAGATGATLFHTRSTDNSKIEQAMGTALQEETDTLFFLTSSEYKLKIMEAVRDSAGLKTEGSAVIFSMPVDDLVGIGRFDAGE